MSNVGSASGLVVGVISSTLLLSLFIVGLRIYARIFVLRAFGLDDAFILISLVLVAMYNSLMLASVHWGYGTPNTYLSTQQYLQAIKLEVIAQVFALLAYSPGKVSIAICLGRIFPGKQLHRVLWFIAVLNVVDFVSIAILIIAQCTPASKQWDPRVSGRCMDPRIVEDYNIIGGVIGALSDFILAGIPWFYVRKLQMATRERIGIGIALSLGFIAGLFAIVKTYYTTTLSSRTDYAYDTVPLVLWCVGEQCALNVSASIPMLRPLIQRKTQRTTCTDPQSDSSDSRIRGIVSVFLGGRFRPLDSIDRDLNQMSVNGVSGIKIERSIEISTFPTTKAERAASKTDVVAF